MTNMETLELRALAFAQKHSNAEISEDYLFNLYKIIAREQMKVDNETFKQYLKSANNDILCT